MSHFSGVKTMNKNIIFSVALFTILLALPLSSVNAGLLDWTDKNVDDVHPLLDNESAWSIDKIYSTIKRTELKDEGDKTAEAQTVTVAEKNYAKKISIKNYAPKATYVVLASAYSSTIDHTDSSPFITAWNTHVRDGIIAANFLPFGTKLKIPDLYGEKIFTVEDRMNKRYTYKIYLWFPERELAKNFGVKQKKIEVL